MSERHPPFRSPLRPPRPAPRDPDDTQTEIDIIEVAVDTVLDGVGERLGVARIPGEPDVDYRARIKDTARVRRYAMRVERGETLVPAAAIAAADAVRVTWVVEYAEPLSGALVRREFAEEPAAARFAGNVAGRVVREERLR